MVPILNQRMPHYYSHQVWESHFQSVSLVCVLHYDFISCHISHVCEVSSSLSSTLVISPCFHRGSFSSGMYITAVTSESYGPHPVVNLAPSTPKPELVFVLTCSDNDKVASLSDWDHIRIHSESFNRQPCFGFLALNPPPPPSLSVEVTLSRCGGLVHW